MNQKFFCSLYENREKLRTKNFVEDKILNEAIYGRKGFEKILQ
jgi:hypothetical protein